jgi:ADP-ribose pyrophosphatase YjhB (NUDIX family)
MKREYPEGPIVAVSAVIFLEGSVLLARRNQEPGKGQWSLPGGAVELPGSDVSNLQFVPIEKFDEFEISTELKETVWKAVDMRNKRIDY